tara:strand:+ start:811 stop:954 length:144 start_codon:yes stop_codon:yes gene_type:complete
MSYWHCEDCHVEVERPWRCKICGQTEQEHLAKVDAHMHGTGKEKEDG